MPYKKNSDLPESVRNNLPEDAQTIFRNAFNNAHEQYKNPASRRNPEESIEAVASQVAWAAVKHEYVKDEETGKWVKK